MTAIAPDRAVERCHRLAKLGPPPKWWRLRRMVRWLRAYRSIMAFDISVGAEMLRDLYSAETVEQMARRPAPFLALVKSERNRGGR